MDSSLPKNKVSRLLYYNTFRVDVSAAILSCCTVISWYASVRAHQSFSSLSICEKPKKSPWPHQITASNFHAYQLLCALKRMSSYIFFECSPYLLHHPLTSYHLVTVFRSIGIKEDVDSSTRSLRAGIC